MLVSVGGKVNYLLEWVYLGHLEMGGAGVCI